MAELLKRLRLYETGGGADWVQFESPHSIAEIKRARKVVKGPFSAMKGQLPRALTLAEHKALGLNAAWYTFLPDQVLKTAAWWFFQEFKKKDMRAWDEFILLHPGTPFTGGAKLPWDATGMTELSKFEAKYAPERKRR
ncbi:MAG: Isocitrate lyase/PEP mutase family protein [Deltaproteobacteria bacterium]|nr:Isocitrate lyase/PEP mutase family protein [Deltaproteobacteria bacterium]